MEKKIHNLGRTFNLAGYLSNMVAPVPLNLALTLPAPKHYASPSVLIKMVLLILAISSFSPICLILASLFCWLWSQLAQICSEPDQLAHICSELAH